jgi:hypothetical protein
MLLLNGLGCAQKNTGGKTSLISPVSSEETKLIRLRISSTQAIQPYEQIELGTQLNDTSQKAVFFFNFFNPEEGLTGKDLITAWILSIHQATQEYFKNYPGDQFLFSRIQASIPKSQCFTDGISQYCGPALLSGFLFLLENHSWKTLHQWLLALSNTLFINRSDELNSAAFQDFVRYFVFGSFKPYQQTSSSNLNETNCLLAYESLENQGELPRRWEINPCHLVLSHKYKRDFNTGG